MHVAARPVVAQSPAKNSTLTLPPQSDVGVLLQRQLSAGANVIDADSLRTEYSRDLGQVPQWLAKLLFRTTPELVVQPRTVEDVQATLAFAGDLGMGVVPRGVASWGFGGAVPTQGGVVIDCSTLDTIDTPDLRAQQVVVGGGAKWGHIDEALGKYGLTLMCFPSSRFSTVGGWVSTGGYGLTAFGRGHLQNSVEWIELVTSTGDLEVLDRADRRFELAFGSEGQLGIITRVALRVERQPESVTPYLVYADRRSVLFELVGALAQLDDDVPMVKYLDGQLLRRFNQLHALEPSAPVAHDPLVEERPAILVQANGRAAAARVGELIARWADQHPDLVAAPEFVARTVWHDRFNPLKIQLLGPSLLAGELVLSPAEADRYLNELNELGRRFKLDFLVESHFLSDASGTLRLLTIPMFLSDRRRPYMYLQHLAMIPLLTHLGVRLGGRPYGIGIWNTPFLRVARTAQSVSQLWRLKKTWDPRGTMNPGKFWELRSRWMGVFGLAFRPKFFRAALEGLAKASAVWGVLVPRRPELADGSAARFLSDVALKCTQCANCVAVCPAYQVTRDERTTARLKLRLGERLDRGGTVEADAAAQTWLCTRCGECERVCQADLPLLAAYDAIEAELRPIYGAPEDKMNAFVHELGQNPDYLRLIQSESFRSA